MRMLAPDLAELAREAGLIHAQLGNMRAAMRSIEEFIANAPEGAARHEAAVVLQQLKAKLN
jgi:regulator of sirC expression with transglutaminase-like and TPR domain